VSLNRGVPDWQLPLTHETNLTDRFKEGGDVFIDVGAHVGTWTLRLAPRFRIVYAFEPNLSAWHVLVRNLYERKMGNVIALPWALSNQKGWVTLYKHEMPSHSTLLPQHPMNDASKVAGEAIVFSITLDDFWREKSDGHIDLIKIDTEGSELDVMKGAETVFKSHRPRFCIETHSVGNCVDAKAMLDGWGLPYEEWSNKVQTYLLSK
jgi:FkbM family methyltransferase